MFVRGEPVLGQVAVKLPRLVGAVLPDAGEDRTEGEGLAGAHEPDPGGAVGRVLHVDRLLERPEADHVAAPVHLNTRDLPVVGDAGGWEVVSLHDHEQAAAPIPHRQPLARPAQRLAGTGVAALAPGPGVRVTHRERRPRPVGLTPVRAGAERVDRRRRLADGGLVQGRARERHRHRRLHHRLDAETGHARIGLCDSRDRQPRNRGGSAQLHPHAEATAVELGDVHGLDVKGLAADLHAGDGEREVPAARAPDAVAPAPVDERGGPERGPVPAALDEVVAQHDLCGGDASRARSRRDSRPRGRRRGPRRSRRPVPQRRRHGASQSPVSAPCANSRSLANAAQRS